MWLSDVFKIFNFNFTQTYKKKKIILFTNPYMVFLSKLCMYAKWYDSHEQLFKYFYYQVPYEMFGLQTKFLYLTRSVNHFIWEIVDHCAAPKRFQEIEIKRFILV